MDWLKKFYIRSVGTVASGIANVVGEVHAPWTQKGLDFDNVIGIRSLIRPGDTILTRTKGELTTVAIPGYWKHAVRYIGEDRCIEAVTPKVRENWLANVVMKTDCIAVLRLLDPKNKEEDLPIEVAMRIVHFTKEYLDYEYDKRFDFRDDSKVCCSEVNFHSTNKAIAEYLGSDEPYLQIWKRFGYPSFTPNDIYKSEGKYYRLIYVSYGEEDESD